MDLGQALTRLAERLDRPTRTETVNLADARNRVAGSAVSAEQGLFFSKAALKR